MKMYSMPSFYCLYKKIHFIWNKIKQNYRSKISNTISGKHVTSCIERHGFPFRGRLWLDSNWNTCEKQSQQARPQQTARAGPSYRHQLTNWIHLKPESKFAWLINFCLFYPGISRHGQLVVAQGPCSWQARDQFRCPNTHRAANAMMFGYSWLHWGRRNCSRLWQGKKSCNNQQWVQLFETVSTLNH